ncbi:E3 ubiquitin-protein ligase TRIM47-like [Hoplias malabaricus]|uniref:E3 ubiquitin-protein ligase TRIM47-like n=1 Tax=Hoplias malabaricus TaxID=27720 RepID=UPI0034623361
MAEASISVQQDHFSCAICLDLLKDPVTTPCGHNFCKECINGCWDQDDQIGVYNCPKCRVTFSPRPVLCKNNVVAEVVEKLKNPDIDKCSPALPEEVTCDFCTEEKCPALQTCLVCLVSFCKTHLKPHLELPALKKHKLIEASTYLQEKVCSQHDKLIEIYCRTDQIYICYLCTMDEHQGHDTVPVVAERMEKQSELKKIQEDVQQTIQEKQNIVHELEQALKTLKHSAETAVKESERIFTELIQSLEKKRSEVTELIRAQETVEVSRGEEIIKKLEREIADLKWRDTELEQLTQTEDHINFLRSFQSRCLSPGPEDSTFTVNQQLSFDSVTKALSSLKEEVELKCMKEFNQIAAYVEEGQVILPPKTNTHEAVNVDYTGLGFQSQYQEGTLFLPPCFPEVVSMSHSYTDTNDNMFS